MDIISTVLPENSGVFITPELDKHSPEAADYLQEKLAIQSLAALMADHPDQVLPRFVDLAMQLTGGISGGLSLYESDPSPGVFRWCFLRGTLAPFDGATTPRNFSPCGITLDQNAPVLTTHPERYYNWVADAGIALAEVLLVPLYIGETTPLGTLWIAADEEEHFHRGHARVLTELAQFVDVALRIRRTEQRLQDALEQQQTLTMEMSHRLKNLFAVTDGMIRISAKNADTKEQLADALSGRLHALASAHTLVSRDLREVGREPRASDLRALLLAVLLPHESGDGYANTRFTLEGPLIACGDRAINGIALVFHELATNAAKYGPLTTQSGSVHIGWAHAQDRVVIDWIERGGPSVPAPPAKSGFGSTLVKNTVLRQFNGTLEYDWSPDGLTVSIGVPALALKD